MSRTIASLIPVAIVLVVLGLLLVIVGARNWRNRADTSEPKAFQAISAIGPAAAAFANRRLDRARAWLVARNRLIMGVICLLLGLLPLARGVAAL